MEIKGTVHCLFEQSGTFKREFKKLGINAVDYDIQDNFGETDFVVDLFAEINKGYSRESESVFDKMDAKDDFVMAFFPCIYFSALSQMQMSLTEVNKRGMTMPERYEAVLERSRNRQTFLELLIKLIGACELRGLRLVVENPWSMQTYLKNGFIKSPSYIDNDRTRRGDHFVKPTAYWFVNCEPMQGFTWQRNGERMLVRDAKPAPRAGLCSEERSMIAPEYAHNFICDQILGITDIGKEVQGTLF